ncbi:MAG: PPOX class F420-dependent oxidoreductase [Phototrophicales bacterium]|nr:MAG: PPOX class F420-dependent oxidoreductase [Phototrophicales bacterium]
MTEQTAAVPFAHLQGHKYMSLVTFRKNGQPVLTPVWFAQVGDKLYVVTRADSGKVKRIRSNAQVEVAPCTMRGDVLGESQEGMARILPDTETSEARRALADKYKLMFQMFALMWRIQRHPLVYLEVQPM